MKKITSFLFLTTVFTLATFCSVAQTATDSTDHRFHDELLDHLVGEWHDTANAHGKDFTSEIDVRWVLNHQFLLIHLKSNEVIPWWGVQMEYYEYIGYSRYKKHYIVHGMSIEGDEDQSDGFCYGYRDGNDFKIVAKFNEDTSIIQHMIWQPATHTWLMQSRMVDHGKEGGVFLNMKLVAVKPSSKIKTKL